MLHDRSGETTTSEAEAATNSDVELRGFSPWRSLRDPRTWISFAVAAAIVVFMLRGLNIDVATTWAYVRTANPWLLAVGFLAFYLTFPLRSLRWRLLLDNAGVTTPADRATWASLPALMEYIMLSWFANCLVPAKLGDAYRGYLLKRNGHVSFSASFGTIFAERLLDMLGLFIFLVISGWFVFGVHLPPAAQLIFAGGLLLAGVVVGGLAGMRWLSPHLRRFIPARVLAKYLPFEAAALRSFRPRVLPQLIGLTGLVWLLEGMRLFFVIRALGADQLGLTLPVVIFTALASSLLTVVPLTPAGLGLVEGTVTTVLALFLPGGAQLAASRSLALAITVLDRLINFWSIIIVGFFTYLFSRRR